MKTIDSRVQSKADLKLESFGSELLRNINEQKFSKPNFVIKRRNITKEKEKIGSKLAIFTNRSEAITDQIDYHHQNPIINRNELLHPIKLELNKISNKERNVTPVMQRRSLQLSAEKKTIKRKTSHNQLHIEKVNGVNEKRYESQRASYNGPIDILRPYNMNVNLKKMAPILPPLIKRDLPVNAAWNHLLNHNLLATFTPSSLTSKAANLFSSRLETQTWRFGKDAVAKELDKTHNSSSREVSLEEIDEKRAGISNEFVNRNYFKVRVSIPPSQYFLILLHYLPFFGFRLTQCWSGWVSLIHPSVSTMVHLDSYLNQVVYYSYYYLVGTLFFTYLYSILFCRV